MGRFDLDAARVHERERPIVPSQLAFPCKTFRVLTLSIQPGVARVEPPHTKA